MDQTEIAYELMRAATCGVSKTQTIRYIKQTYNQTDEQVNQILKLCAFKSKPKHIDYRKFATRLFNTDVKKYNFPFTQIYKLDNFLTSEDCERLINISNKVLRPSTISTAEDASITSDYRTSMTADLNQNSSDYLLYIDNKISSFMKLNPCLGEILQAQKYEPGQYYKEHCDYFFPLTKEFKTYTEWMGQRTWTLMVYLNNVEEGGETYFKHLKLKLKPKAGTAVFWNNLYKNGVPNPKTMHEALSPVSGDKYVITKWFRSWSLI
jgi:prolyl 4-hydroxylase